MAYRAGDAPRDSLSQACGPEAHGSSRAKDGLWVRGEGAVCVSVKFPPRKLRRQAAWPALPPGTVVGPGTSGLCETRFIYSKVNLKH